MERISIVRYSSNNDHSLLEQLADCYRRVFADSPWHEWLKCPRCHKYWGTRDQALLAAGNFYHCNVPLIDFWPQEEISAELCRKLTSQQSSCWLALVDGVVIGFCLGYSTTITDLEVELEINLAELIPWKINGPLAYQSELGVSLAYRERKIAKMLFIRRLQDFLDQDLKIGLVRTRQFPEPSKTFLWYTQKLNYQIINRYPARDGRVILGRKLIGLEALMS